ncbi:MAG: transglutaminase-like domain-containing protein [Bacteroidales bacterium]
MTDNSIDSIIKLLDDPDESVYSSISSRLIEDGLSVVKKLEETWNTSDNPLIQKRIGEITQQIQFRYVCKEMRLWKEVSGKSIIDGMYWIARYQYHNYEKKSLYESLQPLVNDIKDELSDDFTPLEKINIVNHVLFQVHNFSRTLTGYNSPQHFFINNVLDTKKGNTYSLALLYLSVARLCGIEVYGIDIPENFALTFIDSKKSENPFHADSVLFYINPSNKGAVFGKFEIDEYLRRLNIKREEKFFTPLTDIVTIKCTLKALSAAYAKLGYNSKVEEINTLGGIL